MLNGFHIIVNKDSLFEHAYKGNLIKCQCNNNVIIHIYPNKQIKGICSKCGMFPIYVEDN